MPWIVYLCHPFECTCAKRGPRRRATSPNWRFSKGKFTDFDLNSSYEINPNRRDFRKSKRLECARISCVMHYSQFSFYMPTKWKPTDRNTAPVFDRPSDERFNRIMRKKTRKLENIGYPTKGINGKWIKQIEYDYSRKKFKKIHWLNFRFYMLCNKNDVSRRYFRFVSLYIYILYYSL